MKRIKQNKFGKEGNCLNACLATLLSVDINEIPNPKTEDWLKIINNYLIKKHSLQLVPTRFEEDKYFNKEDCYIVSGKSNRGFFHAVIYRNGELFHDPHPDNTGIKEVECYDLLVKVFKEELNAS